MQLAANSELRSNSSNYSDAIMKRWKCEEASCPNNKAWCFITEEGAYKELNNGLIALWSDWIGQGKGLINVPDAAIRAKMIPTKRKRGRTDEAPISAANHTQNSLIADTLAAIKQMFKSAANKDNQFRKSPSPARRRNRYYSRSRSPSPYRRRRRRRSSTISIGASRHLIDILQSDYSRRY